MSDCLCQAWIVVVLAAQLAMTSPGCQRAVESEDGGDERKVVAAEAGPQLTDVVLFVNNYRMGEGHGCYSNGLAPTGELMCGPGDGPAVVTWRFLRRDGDADVYEVRRVSPVHGPSPNAAVPRPGATQTEKTFRYTGGVLVVMEDDSQRVILYPKGMPHPPLVDATTPTAP